MLRVRVDGGALTTEQLRVIGEVSRDYARGTADITDRQNIQLHWVRIEDVPAIWERLEAVGLLTTEACGDCPRVILGSPGRRHRPGRDDRPDAGDRGDPAPLHRRPGVLQPAAQVQDRDHRHARPTTSCTRSTTSRSSASSTPSSAPASTCGSAAASRPTRGWPSGSARSWPRTTCPTCGPASSSVFRDYGYRRLRHQARLKFLVADWGPEKFREVLETEYLKAAAARRPGARAHRRPRRPRRRPRAEGRPLLRRRRPRRGPGLRPTS